MKKREALYLKRLGNKKRVMKTFCSFLQLMLSNTGSRMRGKVYRKEQNLVSHKTTLHKGSEGNLLYDCRQMYIQKTEVKK